MATWLDDFLLAIKRLKANGTLLPPRNNLNFGTGLTVTPGPTDDDYTVTASGTPAWPGTSEQLLAGDGTVVEVGANLTLSGGTLTATGDGATVTVSARAEVGLTVGQVVAFSAAIEQLAAVYADVSNIDRLPAVGIVTALSGFGSHVTATVQLSGTVAGLSGLTPGAAYYVGPAGTLVDWATVESISGTRYAQSVGTAVGDGTIMLNPDPMVIQLA